MRNDASAMAMRLVPWIGRAILFCMPFLGLALAWQVATSAGWIAPLFLPSPADVVAEFSLLLSSGDILEPLGISLYRTAMGLALALGAGIVTGILMARSRRLSWFLQPLLSVGFPAPKIVLIPLFILYFGIGDLSKIILVALTCVFPVIIVIQQAATSLARTFIWSAKSMGTSDSALLWRVVLPAITPAIFTSVRITLPAALITTFTTEMVAGGGGLGANLIFAQRFFETPTVYVYILVMLAVGIVADRLLLVGQKKLVPWFDDKK